MTIQEPFPLLDREEELALICRGSPKYRLQNFHGEAGIGKTRLLGEAEQRLRGDNALVLSIDCAALPDSSAARPADLLRRIVEGADGRVRVFEGAPADEARQVVEELSGQGVARPIVLMLDGTDALQTDNNFWEWLQEYLLGPLLVYGRAQVVLAGRVPAPLHLMKIRAHLQVHQLKPLRTQVAESAMGFDTVEPEAATLARRIIEDAEQANHRMERPGAVSTADLVALTLRFSHGHPRLSEEIAAYLATARLDTDALEQQVATEVVEPFIDREFFCFGSDMERWIPTLKSSTVLEWLDDAVLYRLYNQISHPSVAENQWSDQFIKAMDALRNRYAIVEWREGAYRFIGAIRPIVDSCMKVAHRATRARAVKLAHRAIIEVKNEYYADSPEDAVAYDELLKSLEGEAYLEEAYGDQPAVHS